MAARDEVIDLSSIPWREFTGAFLGAVCAPFLARSVARVFAPGEAIEERRNRRLKQIEDLIDTIDRLASEYWSEPPAAGSSAASRTQGALTGKLHELSRLQDELLDRSPERDECARLWGDVHGMLTGGDFNEPSRRNGEQLAEMSKRLTDLKRSVVRSREQMRRPWFS